MKWCETKSCRASSAAEPLRIEGGIVCLGEGRDIVVVRNSWRGLWDDWDAWGGNGSGDGNGSGSGSGEHAEACTTYVGRERERGRGRGAR